MGRFGGTNVSVLGTPVGGLTFQRFKTLTTHSLNRAMADLAPEIVAEFQKRLSARLSPPRSRPGQVPHMETGALRNSIQVSFSGSKLFVRTALHGKFLDEGTINMRARPFVARILYDERKKFRDRIVTNARTRMR